jgi:peptidoglycan/xylan/chitin deacetylase (PgdA/CDA1 family)
MFKLLPLFYHTVTDEYLPHLSPLYKPKTVREFEEDLEFLLRHFRPISIEEVRLHVTGEKRISKPAFHLSFDDGLREVYTTILPILERKGIPATVFVNSAFVNNRDLFFRYKAALLSKIFPESLKINYLERSKLDELALSAGVDFSDFLRTQQPYLSIGELKTLQQKGFTIGSHSMDHPLYSMLSEEEQLRQTLDSCAFIQNTFAEKQAYFAFPFTEAGVHNSFFEKIFSTIDLTFGISGLRTTQNGRHLGRIDMETYGKNAKQAIYKAYIKGFLKKWIY